MKGLRLHRIRDGRNRGMWVIVGLQPHDLRRNWLYSSRDEAEQDLKRFAIYPREKVTR